MAYQKQTWINLPDRTTPISADRLNHMEDGIEAIDTELENIDTHLTDYVKNTDYASANTGGVIKGNVSGFLVSTNGTPSGDTRTFENYSSAGNALFISKGTLENVITGKGLVSNTDYATDSVGGVIKVDGANYGSYMTSGGILCASMTSYANYGNKSNNYIISKGTLDNVLTARIGDIQTLLDNLDVGNGVS